MTEREREARKLHDAMWPGARWDKNGLTEREALQNGAAYILASRQKREAGLVEALAKLARLGNGVVLGHSEGNMIAQRALAAHARLDAPPEPTLAEQLERELNSFHPGQEQTVRRIVELFSALVRERGK